MAALPDVPSHAQLRVAVAQLGARRGYAVPKALHRLGWLESLITDLTADHWLVSLADRTIPPSLHPRGLQRLLARRVGEVPAERVRHLPSFALRRVSRRAASRTPAALARHYVEQNRAFCRAVVTLGLGQANAVYVYNGAGLEILRLAADLGVRRVVDQTSLPESLLRRLLAAERDRWPGWQHGDEITLASEALAEREEAEWKLADLVICGSSHLVEAIGDCRGPLELARVVPYGADIETLRPASSPRAPGPLRVLFAGTLELRKGIQYLAAAAALVKGRGITVRAVGPNLLLPQGRAEAAETLDLVGPVPRSEMGSHFRWADVFVLPTLAEGSANVIHEALACGLPVITTAAAGSVVRDGSEGFVVPARDPEALADRMAQLATDGGLLRAMAVAARQSAERHSRAHYAHRLHEVLAPLGAEVAVS